MNRRLAVDAAACGAPYARACRGLRVRERVASPHPRHRERPELDDLRTYPLGYSNWITSA